MPSKESSSSNGNAGGRPVDTFITTHFTKTRRQDGRSNRSFYECKYCKTEILHRDNRLLQHISDTTKCKSAPAELRQGALLAIVSKAGVKAVPPETIITSSTPSEGQNQGGGDSAEGVVVSTENGSVTTRKKRKGNDSEVTIHSYLEKPLSKELVDELHAQLLRFFIHANVSFNSAENVFLLKFVKTLRPMYELPSRYVLSHTVLDGESARVKLIEMEALKERKYLTLLVDGWEDEQRRSLYANVVSEVKRRPVVLGLENLTGERANADNIVSTCKTNLEKMAVEAHQIAGLVTDNPTTMQSVRRKWEKSFPWVIVYPCFLHLLNTLIGKVVSHPIMKEVTRKNTRVVSFFNSSHYWGGQVQEVAERQGIKRGMTIHTESRWYALILMLLSVQEHHPALRSVCLRPDAIKKTNGQTPVANDVVRIVVGDYKHWDYTSQLVRYCKPLVDAIGNLESRDATLADCMLELLRCAAHMLSVEVLPTDNFDFSMHARSSFNRQFHEMNTDLHWFLLFLHPTCRKMAISQALHSRTLKHAVTYALQLAKKWKWSKTASDKLVENIKDYYAGKGPFQGSHRDAKTWWEGLSVSNKECPLRGMAIILFGLVPHSADVERLFSNLGGIQGVRRSALDVQTFETLGKLRSHYTGLLDDKARKEGKTTRRTTAHMHTRTDGGMDTELAKEIEDRFTIRPVLSQLYTDGGEDSATIATPEEMTMEQMEAEWEAFEREKENEATQAVRVATQDVSTDTIIVANHYDLTQLDGCLKGIAPEFEQDAHDIHHNRSDTMETTWDEDAILAAHGF